MTLDSINNDVAKHDVEIAELKRRMAKSEENDKSLDRLATIVEMQREDHKETKEYNRQMTTVLQEMSTNIFGLNNEIKEMREDMTSMKGDVENVSGRMDSIEKEEVTRLKKNEESRKSNITKIVIGVATAVISAFALMWFGLK